MTLKYPDLACLRSYFLPILYSFTCSLTKGNVFRQIPVSRLAYIPLEAVLVVERPWFSSIWSNLFAFWILYTPLFELSEVPECIHDNAESVSEKRLLKKFKVRKQRFAILKTWGCKHCNREKLLFADILILVSDVFFKFLNCKKLILTFQILVLMFWIVTKNTPPTVTWHDWCVKLKFVTWLTSATSHPTVRDKLGSVKCWLAAWWNTMSQDHPTQYVISFYLFT